MVTSLFSRRLRRARRSAHQIDQQDRRRHGDKGHESTGQQQLHEDTPSEFTLNKVRIEFAKRVEIPCLHPLLLTEEAVVCILFYYV